MPEKENLILCPNCGSRKGLSFHAHCHAVVRFNIKKGMLVPADELLVGVPLAGIEDPIIQYYSSDGNSRISVFIEDGTITVHCPRCKQIFDVPKEMLIKCKDANCP